MIDDDLVELFAAPPAGPSMGWRYRQGLVTAFNATTYANTVTVGGTTFMDLPCINISADEAAILAAGPNVAVALALLTSDGGTSLLAIVGRLVSP